MWRYAEKAEGELRFTTVFCPAKRRLLFHISNKFSMKYNAISSPCTESFNLQQTTKKRALPSPLSDFYRARELQ
jgi:hypothetical protein